MLAASAVRKLIGLRQVRLHAGYWKAASRICFYWVAPSSTNGEKRMKALVAAIFAAGMSLTPLSSAQAITVTAAPLAEAAQQTSSVVEVQTNRAGGCMRGYMMTPNGCRAIQYGYRRSVHKGAKPPAKK